MIQTKNDGKGKAQSCEASINIDSDSTYWGWWRLQAEGYGADEYSAKQNLRSQLHDLIEQLTKIRNEI